MATISMDRLPTRPFLAVYVVWHPHFEGGRSMADALYQHYRRDHYIDVAGGNGLSVIYRFVDLPNAPAPLAIDYEEAETCAVVVIIDDNLANDSDWMDYVDDLIKRAEESGYRVRVFPVAVTHSALVTASNNVEMLPQAVCVYSWSRLAAENSFGPERRCRLVNELTYQFCRMLRHYLEHLRHPRAVKSVLEKYLQKVRIFISHSKHDDHGVEIARAIRDMMHDQTNLESFFDVVDIPPGLPFSDVLEHFVRVSAVVAVHTDSYSSREWCRREIIEAKRYDVPLVIADCLSDHEERGFPYLGNVPVVRLEPGKYQRLETVIGRLLDEVLKHFLWQCRIQYTANLECIPKPIFIPRPPELISLAGIDILNAMSSAAVVVYPDPPLGLEEASLFGVIAPWLRLRSYTEWLAEAH